MWYISKFSIYNFSLQTSQRVDPEITTKISNLFTLFGQNGSNGIASIMERFTLRRMLTSLLTGIVCFMLVLFLNFSYLTHRIGKYATDVRSTMMSDIAKMNRIVLHAEINTVVTDANPHAPPRTGLTALMHLMTLRDTQAGFRSINDELALDEHLV